MGNLENRRSPRITRRAITQFSGDDKKMRLGVVLNLSETGLFLQTDHLLRLQDQIFISLKTDTTDLISLRGRVVRIQGKVEPAEQGQKMPLQRVFHKKQSSLPPMDKQSRLCGMGIELSAAPEDYIIFVREMLKKKERSQRAVMERFDICLNVQFQSGESFLTEFTENLSRGGMYLTSAQELKPGSPIRLELTIPGLETPVEIEGKVAHESNEAAVRQRCGIGVQFIDLDEQSRALLNHYLQRLEIHRARPERRQSGDLPTKGTLIDYLVPELLLGLFDKKAAGVLTLERHGAKHMLYIKDGQPVYVVVDSYSENLGQYLEKQGKISASDLQRISDKAGVEQLNSGEILIAEGLLDPSQLMQALVEFQEERIRETFSWFEGSFAFEEQTKWPAAVLTLPLNIYRLVFEGINSRFSPDLIRSWVGLDGACAIKCTSLPPDGLAIPPLMDRILRQLSIPRTLAGLAESLKIPLEKVICSAYTLIIAGWAVLDFTGEQVGE